MLDEPIEVALRELVATRRALDALETSLVVRAREQGATWAELAVPLAVSKQGVRKRHLASDPIAATRVRRLTNEEFYAKVQAALAAAGE